MLFTDNFLFFEHDSYGYKPGVWLMPVSQLEVALASQERPEKAAADAGAAPRVVPKGAAK